MKTVTRVPLYSHKVLELTILQQGRTDWWLPEVNKGGLGKQVYKRATRRILVEMEMFFCIGTESMTIIWL